jgi:uncharacterized membrane protein YoaK (UPF0700 family)
LNHSAALIAGKDIPGGKKKAEEIALSTPAPDRLLPALLLALTVVTGSVDAVCYLALGHVFTANMTGNVVFLGFAMAAVPGLSFARSGAALAAFVIGATIGGRLAARLGEGPRRRWASIGFAGEAMLLLAGALLAFGAGGDLLRDPPRLYGLIAVTGIAMGVRNAVVRKLAERDLTTTVLTMTITGIAADSPFAGGTNPGWPRRMLSVTLMFVGAAAGAWLLRYSLALPLAVSGIVSGACALAARAGERKAG